MTRHNFVQCLYNVISDCKLSFYLKPTIKVFGTDGVSEIRSVLTDILFNGCQQTIKLMLSHMNEWNIFWQLWGNSVVFCLFLCPTSSNNASSAQEEQAAATSCFSMQSGNSPEIQNQSISAHMAQNVCGTLNTSVFHTGFYWLLAHCIIREAGHVTITCQLSCFDRITFT